MVSRGEGIKQKRYFRGIRPGLIEARSQQPVRATPSQGISGASAPASLKRAKRFDEVEGLGRYFRGIRPGLIEALGRMLSWQ